MVDIVSKSHRSWNMSRIRSRDTSPEKVVRSALHRLGYRFRIHSQNLPGRPDIVLPRYRTVILVHGCFWHRHPGCKVAYSPKSNRRFWNKKFRENVMRDKRTEIALQEEGWRVIVIWECVVTGPAGLQRRLQTILKATRRVPRRPGNPNSRTTTR